MWLRADAGWGGFVSITKTFGAHAFCSGVAGVCIPAARVYQVHSTYSRKGCGRGGRDGGGGGGDFLVAAGDLDEICVYSAKVDAEVNGLKDV